MSCIDIYICCMSSISLYVFFVFLMLLFFFFKQKTAYEMRISDWSSDVCSSDLCRIRARNDPGAPARRHRHSQAAGRLSGKKKSLSDGMVAELMHRVAGGEQKAAIARDLGISRETLYQYLRYAA